MEEETNMKICPKCGKTIVNGVNGCAMQKECTDCSPIHYYAKPRRMTLEEMGVDYEPLILAAAESEYD